LTFSIFDPTFKSEWANQSGCITSLLIAIQDFQVSGVRCQLIRFLHLKPDCKAFAQKMNKLMCENHFNKSVMLQPELFIRA